MAIKMLRVTVVAAFLPVFWICVLPGQVLAQFPKIDALSGTGDTGSQPAYVVEEPAWLTRSENDRPVLGAIGRFFTEGEWYFSVGASREQWAPTNIRISQPSQGNNFTVYSVRANDDPSWDNTFGGQYNLRLGRFVDAANTWAVEVNFDHTKYTSVLDQTARISGTIAGKTTDANYQLSNQFFSYNLHNGANHLMFNLVKRVPLIGETNEPFSVAAIGKVGVGMMLPHPENVIMGQYSDVGLKTLNNAIGVHNGWWQLDGWTTGIEVGLRVNLTRHVYLELTDKVAFAQLGGVTVYQGSASHNLWMNEVILSLGFTWGGGR